MQLRARRKETEVLSQEGYEFYIHAIDYHLNDSEDLLTLPTPVDSTPSPAHSTPLGASISPKLSPEALEEDIIYAADKTAFDHLKNLPNVRLFKGLFLRKPEISDPDLINSEDSDDSSEFSFEETDSSEIQPQNDQFSESTDKFLRNPEDDDDENPIQFNVNIQTVDKVNEQEDISNKVINKLKTITDTKQLKEYIDTLNQSVFDNYSDFDIMELNLIQLMILRNWFPQPYIYCCKYHNCNYGTNHHQQIDSHLFNTHQEQYQKHNCLSSEIIGYLLEKDTEWYEYDHTNNTYNKLGQINICLINNCNYVTTKTGSAYDHYKKQHKTYLKWRKDAGPFWGLIMSYVKENTTLLTIYELLRPRDCFKCTICGTIVSSVQAMRLHNSQTHINSRQTIRGSRPNNIQEIQIINGSLKEIEIANSQNYKDSEDSSIEKQQSESSSDNEHITINQEETKDITETSQQESETQEVEELHPLNIETQNREESNSSVIEEEKQLNHNAKNTVKILC
ncbi:uncharacterized protein GO595_005574 [Histomonas meleagridis]|uniref:uncharacterized protein n=1 Tax=Histomonas meleagridis TaxID=135588 RepID=UPI00355A2E0C|nr:hypothetical protein GO595_005574 [Histomonas meleagridis]